MAARDFRLITVACPYIGCQERSDVEWTSVHGGMKIVQCWHCSANFVVQAVVTIEPSVLQVEGQQKKTSAYIAETEGRGRKGETGGLDL